MRRNTGIDIESNDCRLWGEALLDGANFNCSGWSLWYGERLASPALDIRNVQPLDQSMSHSTAPISGRRIAELNSPPMGASTNLVTSRWTRPHSLSGSRVASSRMSNEA